MDGTNKIMNEEWRSNNHWSFITTKLISEFTNVQGHYIKITFYYTELLRGKNTYKN